MKLTLSFFEQDTLTVAKALVGAHLIFRNERRQHLVGRIVETEAYKADDPASHAFPLREIYPKDPKTTRKGFELFGAPGLSYFYLNYGMYWMLNVVTEKQGVAGGVLIRAVEPLEGLKVIHKNRPKVKRVEDLTNGPGKLTVAFGLDYQYHQISMTKEPLYFDLQKGAVDIKATQRIGITKGVERRWRYIDAESRFVSPSKFN